MRRKTRRAWACSELHCCAAPHGQTSLLASAVSRCASSVGPADFPHLSLSHTRPPRSGLERAPRRQLFTKSACVPQASAPAGARPARAAAAARRAPARHPPTSCFLLVQHKVRPTTLKPLALPSALPRAARPTPGRDSFAWWGAPGPHGRRGARWPLAGPYRSRRSIEFETRARGYSVTILRCWFCKTLLYILKRKQGDGGGGGGDGAGRGALRGPAVEPRTMVSGATKVRHIQGAHVSIS